MDLFEKVFNAVMGAIVIGMLLILLLIVLAGVGMVGITCYRELMAVWAG